MIKKNGGRVTVTSIDVTGNKVSVVVIDINVFMFDPFNTTATKKLIEGFKNQLIVSGWVVTRVEPPTGLRKPAKVQLWIDSVANQQKSKICVKQRNVKRF
ncbi:MAG: hypothetical protein ACO4CS_15740 [bacterium]